MNSTRILRVEAPHFVAGSVWQRLPTGWACTHVAPILSWMNGKTLEQVDNHLTAKGWRYSWCRPPLTL